MSTVTKYHTLVFRLQALTNLHAGSGDSFYGAVDKLVQRDPATRRPTIHSHSLKGALREYFEQKSSPSFVEHVFGSAVSGDANAAMQGRYRFFSADLLAIPVPDENVSSNTAFKLTTTERVWLDFFKKLQMLGGRNLEEESLKTALKKDLPAFFLDEAKFSEASEELPVVARNQLDNGESKNLWYEELVPHQSVFGFIVQAERKELIDAELNEFVEKLNGQVLQIGANATVGYGYCLLTVLNPIA